ncbi:UNVERIFIED_ORG: hypothetical protein ABIC97_002085 [Peribacillus simplex]
MGPIMGMDYLNLIKPLLFFLKAALSLLNYMIMLKFGYQT